MKRLHLKVLGQLFKYDRLMDCVESICFSSIRVLLVVTCNLS